MATAVRSKATREAKPASLRRFRREMILSAAADLFRRHGYDGVAIEAIGAACGVTGPAVYRHFKSKQDLLVALVDRGADRVAQDMRGVLEPPGTTPHEKLVGLVKVSVAAAIEGPYLIAAYYQQNTLSDSARKRIRVRQRQILDVWVTALLQVRDDLSRPEAESAVIATLALVVAIARSDSRLPRGRLRELGTALALGALTAGIASEVNPP